METGVKPEKANKDKHRANTLAQPRIREAINELVPRTKTQSKKDININKLVPPPLPPLPSLSTAFHPCNLFSILHKPSFPLPIFAKVPRAPCTVSSDLPNAKGVPLGEEAAGPGALVPGDFLCVQTQLRLRGQACGWLSF